MWGTIVRPQNTEFTKHPACIPFWYRPNQPISHNVFILDYVLDHLLLLGFVSSFLKLAFSRLRGRSLDLLILIVGCFLCLFTFSMRS